MKKLIILIITILCYTGIASAYEMCNNEIDAGVIGIIAPCTMLTPTLHCDVYTYNMTSINTTIVTNGTLKYFTEDIYQFNITEPVGNYMSILCDGTTREIIIIEVDNMFNILWLIIGATLVFLTLSFVFANYTLALMSGLLLIWLGTWIVMYGIDGTTNFLTVGFGSLLIGLGAWMMIKSSHEIMGGE